MDVETMAAISKIIKNAVITCVVLAEKIHKNLSKKKSADSGKSTADDSDDKS
jgi:hypothetical protein